MVKSSAKHHKGNVLCNILSDIMRDEYLGKRGWEVVFHADFTLMDWGIMSEEMMGEKVRGDLKMGWD